MELPKIERIGDSWGLVWPEHNVSFGFERLKQGRDGLMGSVTIEADRPDIHGRVLGPVRISLEDSRSQLSIANSLVKRVNHAPWFDLTVQACAIVAKQFNAASPTVRLHEVGDVGPVQYLVPGLLPLGETTFIYGDSESCKSLLAQRIALSVQAGIPLPWGTPIEESSNVLYLDWETNDRVVAWRMRRLCKGATGYSELPPVSYRGTLSGRRDAPPLRLLEDELPNIREQIIKENIGLVVIDSIGFAIRGKLTDDDVARQAMIDLRMLAPATRLVVAHISKASANDDTSKRTDPFGSAFFRAGLRSGFEAKKAADETDDEKEVGIYQWKHNDGPHAKPFGLKLRFHGQESITIDKADIMDVADLAVRTPLSTRIRAMLKQGSVDTKEIATELDASEAVIRNTLRRMPDVQQLNQGVKGQPATWGLSAGDHW